jgi:hypothetical protein
MGLAYTRATMEGDQLELDRDDLTPLLEQLVEQSPRGSRELGKMRRLEGEQRDLLSRLEKSRQRHARWQKSKSTLDHLIAEHDFIGQLQELGRPYRLLGGEISLDEDRQRHAISELVVTLESEGRGRPIVQQIARALNLYYREFFMDGQGPEEEDGDLVSEEQSFREDKERGGNPAYGGYLKFLNLVKKKDLSSLGESKSDWPVYAPILLAEAILDAGEDLDFRRDTFALTHWERSHDHLLYRIFSREKNVDFSKTILEVLRSSGPEHHLPFFDRQFTGGHREELVVAELTSLEPSVQEELRTLALEKNCAQVLAVLTNALGMAPSLYYQALKQEGIETDVFSRLVEWLFKPISKRHYGMDAVYAQKVLEEQKDWPRKMISVMQNAMPRGIEGQSLASALTFFEGLQEKRLNLAREKSSVNPQREGRRHCELSLALSDLESARFILFSYIHDRIVAGKALPKLMGMSQAELAIRLVRVENFEMEVGPNQNIREHLFNLFKEFPVLKMGNQAEVS